MPRLTTGLKCDTCLDFQSYETGDVIGWTVCGTNGERLTCKSKKEKDEKTNS